MINPKVKRCDQIKKYRFTFELGDDLGINNLQILQEATLRKTITQHTLKAEKV